MVFYTAQSLHFEVKVRQVFIDTKHTLKERKSERERERFVLLELMEMEPKTTFAQVQKFLFLKIYLFSWTSGLQKRWWEQKSFICCLAALLPCIAARDRARVGLGQGRTGPG